MHIGAELGLTNWLSALVLGVTAGLAYAHRVRVEERALRASLGEATRSTCGGLRGSFPLCFDDYPGIGERTDSLVLLATLRGGEELGMTMRKMSSARG